MTEAHRVPTQRGRLKMPTRGKVRMRFPGLSPDPSSILYPLLTHPRAAAPLTAG